MNIEAPFAPNPAVTSAALGDLFPDGAIVAELRAPGDPALLLPGEAGYLGRSVPKRAGEFAAGRLCARRALAEFGFGSFAVRVAPDRQPIWPASMIGSITHTAGLCAAVVAERKRVMGIGIDSERVGAVTADIWSAICLTRELSWIASLSGVEQAAAITLIFAAKEAFYKCQYPLVGEWLEFHDVHVEVAVWHRHTGQFSIRPMRRLALGERARLPLTGRYLFHEQFVSAGIAIQ